jgi:hypothetical protein
MGTYLHLGRDVLLGTFMLAGLSGVLLTLLILAACSHPVLPIVAMLLIAGALAQR